MTVVTKGLTLEGVPVSRKDRKRNKSLAEESIIVDFTKTPRGVIRNKVFDPIPLHTGTKKAYLHKEKFFSLTSGLKFSIETKDSKNYKTNLIFNKELTARDYQLPIIEKLSLIEDKQALALTLATGRGKTFTICKVLSILNEKTFIYIKAEYVEKWVKDIKFYFNLEDDEFYIVKGSASLLSLISDEAPDVKIYIIAMQTFRVYIENYLGNKMEYPITPPDFLEHIGANLMLVDEGHEAFENIYRAVAILSPNKVFLLTATLFNVDERVNKYIDEFLPEANRITDGYVNKHATVIGVKYTLNPGKRFVCKTHMGYSHIMMEKSIRRRSKFVNDFFNMYKVFIDIYFIKKYVKGDKVVIFFSTKEMCRLFIEFISDQFTKLKCCMYVQGCTFDMVEDNDIIATTIGKMGSAIDVPNLTCVLQTVVVSSRTKNEQTIGRLRPMTGRDLNYVYFNAVNIDAHIRNFNMRHSILQRVSEKVVTMRYKDMLG